MNWKLQISRCVVWAVTFTCQAIAVGQVLAPSDRAHRAVTGTFSIVATDPETGFCGAAVASKYPAVGTVVPYARAGIGAFCTQHWHEPKWGERALDLLAEGRLPEEVLGELLRDDKNRDKIREGVPIQKERKLLLLLLYSPGFLGFFSPNFLPTFCVLDPSKGCRLKVLLAAALHALIPLALKCGSEGNSPERAIRASAS